jgi:hypothetical protein
VCVKEVEVFTMVRTQNRKTVTLRLMIRRENVKLDKLNFKPKYRMVYNISLISFPIDLTPNNGIIFEV